MRTKTFHGVEVRQSPLYPTLFVAEDGRILGPTNKWLKAKAQSRKYLAVKYTTTEGKQKNAKVHRAVASAWLGTAEPGSVVDHIDRDTRNNHARNLRWVTPTQNMQNTTRVITHWLDASRRVQFMHGQWYALAMVGPFTTEEEALKNIR